MRPVAMEEARVSECPNREHCPHLGFESAHKVVLERKLLRGRIARMENLMNLAAEKISSLQGRICALEQENERLRGEVRQAHGIPFKKNRGKTPEDGFLLAAGEDPKPRKRGAPVGHPGTTRKRPEEIDEWVDVFLKTCPICGSTDLSPASEVEEHVQEDIEIRKAKTTCYRHHHAYCRRCKKVVSAKGQNELSRAYIGPVAKAVASHLRYGIGVSYGNVEKIFRELFGLKITPSALVGFDKRLEEKGLPLYEKLKQKVRWSTSIHSDETGWRLDGVNVWLWCFTNPQLAFYLIDPRRSSSVVEEIIGPKYEGVLVSDFYSAYNPIKAQAKQKCTVHLLRDIRKVLEDAALDIGSKFFLKGAKSLIQTALDAQKEYQIGKVTRESLVSLRDEIAKELINLVSSGLKNEEAEKLRKRILRHGEEIFTFLVHPEVEPNNNRAERQLRPNVILRKISFGNRSEQGTKNHSVIMSLIQTAKLNGSNPKDFLFSLLTDSPGENSHRLLVRTVEPRPP